MRPSREGLLILVSFVLQTLSALDPAQTRMLLSAHDLCCANRMEVRGLAFISEGDFEEVLASGNVCLVNKEENLGRDLTT